MFYKEISGVRGEGVKELFEDTLKLLFFDVNNMENDNKMFDVSLSYYKSLENEINLSYQEKSYHNKEYKKEIKKINKKRRANFCCLNCTIF